MYASCSVDTDSEEVDVDSISDSLINFEMDSEDHSSNEDSTSLSSLFDKVRLDGNFKQVDQFAAELFFMSQFNVHYLSWIKNPDYFYSFFDRFTCLYDNLLDLCKLHQNIKNFELFHQWFLAKAIRETFNYSRCLVVKLEKVIGIDYFTTKKKLVIYLDPGKSDKFNDEMLSDCTIQSEDGKIFDESENSSQDICQFTSAIERTRRIFTIEFQKMKQKFEPNPTGRLLGELELRNNSICCFTIPSDLDLSCDRLYIKFLMYDIDPQDGEIAESALPDFSKHYFCISLDEGIISGYTGFSKEFKFLLPDTNDSISFKMELKWKINPENYHNMKLNPSLVLSRLSGTLLYLGNYYWTFCKNFYRAMTMSVDPTLRTIALQQFYRLCSVLPLFVIRSDMAENFVQLYSGGHPQGDESLDCTIDEWLMMADNIVFVFPHLSTDDQIKSLSNLLPFIDLMFRERIKTFNYLLQYIKMSMGNFESDDIVKIVTPMCRTLMNLITSLENESTNVEWPTVNKMLLNVVKLHEDCIDCLKPQEWMSANIDHDSMVNIRITIEELMDTLLNPRGYRLASIIYTRLRFEKILYEHHLKPFLSDERVIHYSTMIDWLQ